MNDMAMQPHRQPLHRFRDCDKCKKAKPPEGGVQMNPTKWLCAQCWAARAATAPRRPK